MEDIAPKLLEQIKTAFSDEYNRNKTIKDCLAKLDKGADYNVATVYAIAVGEILSKVFDRYLSSAVLPDGHMYYNIAERILNEMLGNNFKLITEVSSKAQDFINKKLGIVISFIKPSIDQDNIDMIINRITAEEIFDNVKWVLDDPVVNFSQSVVDSCIESNASFHSKAGLKPMIVRRMAGNCCDWCQAQAGVYVYPKVPKDVYRRHNNCRCTVSYEYEGTSKKI